MNDDETVERMRALASDVPPVRIDRTAVLTKGRRRRAARALGVASGVGVLGAVAAVAAAAAPQFLGPPPTPAGTTSPTATAMATAPATAEPSPSAAPPSDPAQARAVIDEAAGTIVLPWDEYSLGAEEEAIRESAGQLFMVNCLTEAGFGDSVWFHELQPTRMVHGTVYGIWRVEDAERDGYLSLDAEPADVHIEPSGSGSLTWYQACDDKMMATGMAGAVPYVPEMLAVVAEAMEGGTPDDGSWPGEPVRAILTDEGRAIVDEWKQCIAAQGVTPREPEDNGLVPAGAMIGTGPGDARDGQIAMARVDVQCKLQHDTVRRLADLDARLQAQFIADHRDAVDVQKQANDESLRKAVEYLEQHGWDVPGR
ncbi:hypothetical protein L1785_04855 [Antribacter sp. KLBMP9083]|uniref:Uncharacterized protein n=1 Tax=Antribacter soli TaxID=2910976 RepID=A0AA41QBC0_9MICO|nr:hypothetical protein [Antribacter soli]MCF4120304.1 hypothetical protein [Antribacter soli]